MSDAQLFKDYGHRYDFEHQSIAFNIMQRELTFNEECELSRYAFTTTDKINDRYNEITINKDVVRTNGNSLIITKKGVEKIISQLQAMLPEYDKRMEKVKTKMDAEFVKAVKKLKKKDNLNKPHTPLKRQGFIYVMKCMGNYKIGRCDLKKSRLGEYTKLPEEPEYIIMEKVPDTIIAEKEIHEMLSEKRLRDGKCEWFDLDASDIESIKAYLKEITYE